LNKSNLTGMSSGGQNTPLDRSGNLGPTGTEMEQSGLPDFTSRDLSLDILMKIDLKNQDQVDYAIQ